jgi:hypothetical protein
MIATTYTIGTPAGVFQANWDDDEDIAVTYTGDEAAIRFFRAYLDLAAPTARGGALVRFDALEPEDLGFIAVENAPVFVVDPLEQLEPDEDPEDTEEPMSLLLDSADADTFALIGEGAQLLAGLNEDAESFFDDLSRLREIIAALGADAAPVAPAVDVGGKVFANEPQHYADNEMGTRRYRVMGGKLAPNTPAARRYLEYPVVGSNADYVAQNARLERKGDTFQLTYDLDRPFPTTVEVEGDPTPESLDYQAGFNAGMAAAKPKLTDAMIRKNTDQWVEGYRAAVRDLSEFPEMAARDREEILSYLASLAHVVEPEPVIEPAPAHTEQFESYRRAIEEAKAAGTLASMPGLLEQIRVDARLNDGEAEELLALAEIAPVEPEPVIEPAPVEPVIEPAPPAPTPEPTPVKVAFAEYLLPSQRTIKTLREIDIYRVLVAAPEEHRAAFAQWIIERRPDLADEVQHVMRAEWPGETPTDPALPTEDRAVTVTDPLPEEGAAVPPALGEVTESTPERDADMAFLRSVTAGEIDMWENDPADRIEAVVGTYAADEAVLALAREAIDAYTNFMSQALQNA